MSRTVPASLPSSLALWALTLGLAGCLHSRPEVRSTRAVATFHPGEFLESVASSPDGTFFITALRADGATQLVRVRPEQPPEVFSALPNIGCVALSPQGDIFVTVTAFNKPDTLPGVWRVSPQGQASLVAELPAQAFPNGLHVDGQGHLFVADSALATVWRIPSGTRKAEAWLQHPLLAPDPGKPGIPGANGIKSFKGALYVSNSSQDTVLRIPLQADGAPGHPSLHARVEGPDDFDVDEQGGLYVTQHLHNTLSYVPPSGDNPQVLLDSRQGLWGPTAALFSRRPGEEDTLYLVMDGNFFAARLAPRSSGQGELHPSLLLRVNVGVRGAPRP